MNIEKLATSAVEESISKTDVLDPWFPGCLYIQVEQKKHNVCNCTGKNVFELF